VRTKRGLCPAFEWQKAARERTRPSDCRVLWPRAAALDSSAQIAGQRPRWVDSGGRKVGGGQAATIADQDQGLPQGKEFPFVQCASGAAADLVAGRNYMAVIRNALGCWLYCKVTPSVGAAGRFPF